jgi:hypothetical protein
MHGPPPLSFNVHARAAAAPAFMALLAILQNAARITPLITVPAASSSSSLIH